MYTEFENKMKKTLEVLHSQFSSVRAGRANASVLEHIRVEYYGAPTPIQQIASVSTPDPRTLVIQPWDASSLKAVEKAIQTSDLGINPQNDGRVIRLLFPQLTEERRRELVKQVAKYGEESKVAIRNIRRDAMEAFKAQKKKSEITEDDLKDIEKDLRS
jgi:ribosome recycling factor